MMDCEDYAAWRFVFGNGQMSSWYKLDTPDAWGKLPPSIQNGHFTAVIVEEKISKEEFKKRYPDIKI